MNGTGKPNGAPREIADQRVRERIRNDLDTTLIVEAAAGTGKTTALVNRIVAALAGGRAELGRIVAVTFTEKAAGELKLRLRGEIESARSDSARDPGERTRLSGALGQLEEARIGTIHSFCADLLRERPVDARVDPMFEVAADDVAGELFESAFDRWFEQALGAPGEGLRRLLRRREGFDREGPRPIIRAAAWELLQWRDFDAPWRHQAFDRDPEIDALVEEIRALGALAEHVDPEDWLGKALDEIARPIDEATRLETVRGRDYDALEAALLALLRGYDGRWRWKGWGENFGALPRAEVMARRDALHARLTRFRDAAGANLAPLLRDELWPIVGYYEEAKKRAGVLDFIDLLAGRPRSRARPRRRARRAAAAHQPHLRRRVPGHRSAAGGNPAAARRRRSGRVRLASRAPTARQTVYRGRPQAIDLSLPPRRRRALPGRQAPPARVRRRAGASNGQLSRDARNAARGQRRLRAADAVGVADPARLLAADAVSRGLPHAAVDRRVARARALQRARLRRPSAQSTNRRPTRQARWCDGWSRRADGR